MPFLGEARRRTVVLLGAGVLLFFALLGGLNAFNIPNVRCLNPETTGETLAFTGLTVVVFLLLIVLLLLLLRSIPEAVCGPGQQRLGRRSFARAWCSARY